MRRKQILHKIKLSSKRTLIRVMETEFLGRLLRKSVYLIIKFLEHAHKYTTQFYGVLPYIRSVNERETNRFANSYYQTLAGYVGNWPRKPLVSILIPVFRPQRHHLEECLESACAQIYGNWELCIVDDSSGMPWIAEVVEAFAKRFPNKIKFSSHSTNQHISRTLNSCLGLAKGQFIALLDHDDRLYPNALAEFVRYHNVYPQADVFYSDERVIREDGERIGMPFYKPNWSPFFHLSVNYTTHLSIYRTTLANEIGGFREGLEGSQDHDFMLRAVEASSANVIHIPFCLYQWRAHPQSTASSISAKPYAAIAGEKAVKQHLERKGRLATVSYDPKTFHYRIRYELPKLLPRVSILIPSKEYVQTLKTCLDSIWKTSTYKNFEIIISDNGSESPECLGYYDTLRSLYKEQFQLVKDSFPFNFCRQINAAAKRARGDYLLFLNNDTEVITPDWIEEMLQLAQFDEVGAVGGKLLYPDDLSIQHAGIALSIENIADHEGVFQKADSRIHCDMLNTVRDVEAVTAACLMVSREKFEKLNGLDEVFLPNVYGDVEFCMRLRQRGLTNLYTPFAVLKHYESKSRGKASIEEFERFYLQDQYKTQLARDSYNNPRLDTYGAKGIRHRFWTLDLNNKFFRSYLASKLQETVSKSLSSPCKCKESLERSKQGQFESQQQHAQFVS